MSRDPFRYFRVEGRELLDDLGKGLLELEKAPSPAVVARLLRSAHTLKGAARVVRASVIADVVHAFEGALEPYREDSQLPAGEVTRLLLWVDQMSESLKSLGASAPAPQKTPDNEKDEATLGGDVDSLLEDVTEAYARVATLRETIGDAARIESLLGLLTGQLVAPAASLRARAMAEELQALAGRLQRKLEAGIEVLERELRQVREATEQLRLVSATALFTPLERVMRDAAQETQKRVRFLGKGVEVRLDATLLTTMQGAFTQAVRNAVAHGIEAEKERVALGKPPEGVVTVQIRRAGSQVFFTCSDDGQGVDVGAVRRALRRSGMSEADTQNLDTPALLQKLVSGGISTTETVTQVSGRGIGLDVIREAAQRLGGSLRVTTTAGVGTTVEVQVPVSIASLEALLVQVGEARALIPLEAVRHTQKLPPSAAAHVQYEGSALPYLPLGPALAQASPGPGAFVVIVEAPAGMAALGVHRLIGTVSVVLRPLPPLAPSSSLVAGVAFNADGDPLVVLDAAGWVEAARHTAAPAMPEPCAVPRILVIDDSLTTRMLEQSILESAGYRVDVASSAEEGLEMARQQSYSLFLVDVEMPGMDGFTFIERTRQDDQLRAVPSVLVTSLSSVEHKRRGQEVGARGYMVKSEFDQKDLLDTIRNLCR